jgi:hypothetical protein
MQKTLNDTAELAAAIEDRVLCGGKVVLSPPTALWLARQLQSIVARQQAARSRTKFDVDLYSTGSCVMEVDGAADIVEVVGWARSSLAARAAFEYLSAHNPEKSFHQRRRSWVEAQRIVKRR